MLSKSRCKTTSGFFVIPLLSQLWGEKNYCERRNELSSWRPVALPNCHKHLCLFKLGYDLHALLSSVMYILSGKKITAVYPMSRRRWDQNTSQVANRLNRARATYIRLLHVPLFLHDGHTVSGFSRFPANESLGRSGLHSSLSAKFSFYLYLHLRSPVHVVPPLVIDVFSFFNFASIL